MIVMKETWISNSINIVSMKLFVDNGEIIWRNRSVDK